MNRKKKICDEGLESERLYFRKLYLEDIQDMFEFCSQKNTCHYLKWGPYSDITQAEAFIREKIQNYENPEDILFGIELKEEKKLIGVIRIYNITEKSGEVSYILNSLFTGNGYMTEAVKRMINLCFEKLKLVSVKACYAEDNLASEQVMKKAGMKKDNGYEAYEIIKGQEKKLLRYKIEGKTET